MYTANNLRSLTGGGVNEEEELNVIFPLYIKPDEVINADIASQLCKVSKIVIFITNSKHVSIHKN